MPLKVLHVLDHSVPLHSGYAFRTLAILREQQALGWQTLQVTTPKQGTSGATDEIVEGFRFLRTDSGKADGLVSQMRSTATVLRRAIEEFRPDIVHAHSPVLTALPSLYVLRGTTTPLVYEMRASWEDAAVDHGTTTGGSLRYRLSRSGETFVFRRADHVTTICGGLRDDIVSRGIAPEKVTVIPNAVDVSRFEYHDAASHSARERLGLGPATTIGFIGSFYGYEGLDDLLRAVAVLKQRGADVQAVMVGGGPEADRLQALAASLGLDDRVTFPGRVSQDEVQDWYRAIDLLVYPRKPTRLTETVTPLKPLEAMAQGNLVLASDVGGHRELIRDGETGRLFPAGKVDAIADAVAGMLDDPEAWPAMRRAGRDFVEKERNWARSVAGYRHAYSHALARKGKPSGIVDGVGR
jgi:PEP-CTERM/exosortase A-associated glycosyltransferase